MATAEEVGGGRGGYGWWGNWLDWWLVELLVLWYIQTRRLLVLAIATTTTTRNLRPIHRHILPSTGGHETGSLDAHVVHLMHQLCGELVVPSKPQQLVLEVALVEEDDVHVDTINLVDGSHFRDNLRTVITLVLDAELEHAGLEFFDLGFGGAEAERQVDGVGKTLAATLVEDKERVEDRVGCLHDVALHFLELGVEKRDLKDVVVVATHQGTGVTVDGYAVADIEGVLDEDEEDGLVIGQFYSTQFAVMGATYLKELLGRRLQQPRQTQNNGARRGQCSSS